MLKRLRKTIILNYLLYFYFFLAICMIWVAWFESYQILLLHYSLRKNCPLCHSFPVIPCSIIDFDYCYILRFRGLQYWFCIFRFKKKQIRQPQIFVLRMWRYLRLGWLQDLGSNRHWFGCLTYFGLPDYRIAIIDSNSLSVTFHFRINGASSLILWAKTAPYCSSSGSLFATTRGLVFAPICLYQSQSGALAVQLFWHWAASWVASLFQVTNPGNQASFSIAARCCAALRPPYLGL